jgi:2-polyprenyl-6-hydroxyphenyl methylase/3-demethylubiquinone-9 3-methyltransferase
MQHDKITFSFGENWKSLAGKVTQDEIQSAARDIELWLDKEKIKGKSILDIGSGSGLHSLAFYLLEANKIYSFDNDPRSVEATNLLRNRVDSPENWTVSHGSVLDHAFLKNLGAFDIVYSWGVLHHTGNIWQAIENASSLVKENGIFFISIYKKGPNYKRDLAMKQKYNRVSPLLKYLMERRKILGVMKRRMKRFKNPFTWNEKKNRGMNVYHDIIDWLGGLPYEVATEDEIIRFLRPKGFCLERIQPNPESTCSVYVFSKLNGE